MERIFYHKWFRNISIANKLYFVVGIMAVLIALELGTLFFAISTLSSVRALVGGEGLWSKAQKNAIYSLQKYYRTHDDQDEQAFYDFMKVPLGDHKTRVELMKPDPDLEIARQGFLEGRNHPDDIDGMIKLLRRFHSISYIKKAIGIWIEADSIIAELTPIAVKLHEEIHAPSSSQNRLNEMISETVPINQKLTVLEDDFSFTLGEGSRWLENLILKLLFTVALTVELTGLLLTVSVSRGITKGLDEVNRVAKKISQGDLNERIHVHTNDEIGTVSASINQMTEQLVRSQKEAEQFAYIASHDLQEPLRTITNYVGLFKEQFQDKLDTESKEYLSFIQGAAHRMQTQIKDLLDFSRIGRNQNKTEVNCNLLLQEILEDLSKSISETNAEIHVGQLPALVGYPAELKSLFQNLISNAIKFRKAEEKPIVEITAHYKNNSWTIGVRDNGIGIDEKYFAKLFIIFQRLHNKDAYPGTGIGLAQCKKIVELHNGKIWIESVPGEGSTFYFTIPKNSTP